MYACMHVCMYACMRVCMYIGMYVFMYVSMYIFMYYVCMYVFMHVRMSMCWFSRVYDISHGLPDLARLASHTRLRWENVSSCNTSCDICRRQELSPMPASRSFGTDTTTVSKRGLFRSPYIAFPFNTTGQRGRVG